MTAPNDPEVPVLSDTARSLFRHEAVMPLGWRWCPDCNGVGVISTMQATPDMDEVERPCRRCEAECGIVPDPAGAVE